MDLPLTPVYLPLTQMLCLSVVTACLTVCLMFDELKVTLLPAVVENVLLEDVDPLLPSSNHSRMRARRHPLLNPLVDRRILGEDLLRHRSSDHQQQSVDRPCEG